MAKSRADIEQVVTEVLRGFIDGEKPIASTDKPISGLGLTSLDGVDFACELEKKLGCQIPAKLNPFVQDGTDGERSVSQIVDLMTNLYAGEAKEGT